MYHPSCNLRALATTPAATPNPVSRSFVRRLCAPLLLGGALISTIAAADVDGYPSLAAAALDLDQAARATEDAASAASGNVEFYVGNQVDGLLLRYVSAQIDDGRAVQYEYSEAEATALSQRGLQRLFAVQLAPGTHRLRLEYTARKQHYSPGDPLIRSWLDQKFEIAAGARWLEADLVNQGFVEKTPQMKLRALTAVAAPAVPLSPEEVARSNAFGIGSEDDPRLRYARFLLAEDRPLDAASELMHLQANSEGVALPGSFSARLNAILASLDHASPAAFSAPSDTAAAAATNDFAGYRAAVQLVANGHTDAAAADLDKLGQTKPLDSASWALRDEANLSLGYAQLHAGQGAAAVVSFGRVRAQGPFSARALLGLGWAYLDGEGDPAQAVAGAVAGTQSANAAAGDLRPGFIGEVERRQKRNGLYTTPPTATQLLALRRAMVPWTELIGRNPMDPAVQEGLVAIGYALDHTGAFEDAQRFYQRSIKLQETTLTRLASANAQVNDGRMLAAVQRGAGSGADSGADSGWHWQLPEVVEDSHWWLTLNDDPKVPDDFYFDELLAEPDFDAALRQYHQLQNLIGNCDEHLQTLARTANDSAGLSQRLQALKSRLLAASAASGEQLKSVALTDLQQQQQQAQAYLVEARFALARSNDWAPTELAKK